MNKNVGGIDRKARLVVGPLLLLVGIAAFLGAVPLGTLGSAVSVVVGAVLTVTGATQRCPLHVLLGVNTCPVDAR
ncbi:YgaP family membrane protein [Salinigranum halophilum]|jgi:hypothetical protein|uniref:YgaP family membrane protein n=1 Tax=Salinigranum halophilum TaxID=2565931 RepID=UPI0010A7900E|nr:DUF2892 domain-containing protein [Salinigranum halophilum]